MPFVFKKTFVTIDPLKKIPLQKNFFMLRIGLEYELEIIVTPKDTAKAYGSGLVEVFATPAMIALMEKTSLELVTPFLEPGKNTVGTEVHVKHIKATPLGQRVQSWAQLTEMDGNKLTFSVEAYDENGLIGSGFHKRYIIDEAQFMAKLENQ
jgi:predicted thioesterase